ncbi:MAG: TrmH family RNA methyltransferase [Candidatus Cyclobacteriaceae bacterium M2_1C_046]
MTDREVKELTNYFRDYVTEHKQQLFEKILNDRTKHLTVVLEDIYQSQNASAVVRTCDCLGVQEVHIIENENKYKLNKDVVLGAYKWIDIVQYNNEDQNTATALKQLKKRGYKIVITVPDSAVTTIDEMDLTSPVALVFGTEKIGLSKEAYEMADEQVTIPMYGFTESFNISVSAALILHTLRKRMIAEGVDFKLDKKEKDLLRLKWYKRLVRSADLMEQHFLNTNRGEKS